MPELLTLRLLSFPYPLLLRNAASSTEPPTDWLLVLPNNNQCVFIDGASGFVDGMRENYACPDGSLFGEIKYGMVWRILYQPMGSSAMTTVPIVATYS